MPIQGEIMGLTYAALKLTNLFNRQFATSQLSGGLGKVNALPIRKLISSWDHEIK
jgi:hypothetical protein